MSRDQSLPIELGELERRLASLSPAASRLDRDRVMYSAGAAAALCLPASTVESPANDARRWKWATLALAASVVVLASTTLHAYLTRPAIERFFVDRAPERKIASPEALPRVPDPPARSDEPSGSHSAVASITPPSVPFLIPASSCTSYLHERNLALLRGVDALPVSRVRAVERSPAPTVRDLLDELLPGRDDSTNSDPQSPRWVL